MYLAIGACSRIFPTKDVRPILNPRATPGSCAGPPSRGGGGPAPAPGHEPGEREATRVGRATSRRTGQRGALRLVVQDSGLDQDAAARSITLAQLEAITRTLGAEARIVLGLRPGSLLPLPRRGAGARPAARKTGLPVGSTRDVPAGALRRLRLRGSLRTPARARDGNPSGRPERPARGATPRGLELAGVAGGASRLPWISRRGHEGGGKGAASRRAGLARAKDVRRRRHDDPWPAHPSPMGEGRAALAGFVQCRTPDGASIAADEPV